MGEGWIKLHRQIFDNEMYFAAPFDEMRAWIDLLLLANHAPRTVIIRGITLHVQRGELCYSIVSLAKRWQRDRKTVARYLTAFAQRGMIRYTSSKVTTVITIANYEAYQGNGDENLNAARNELESPKTPQQNFPCVSRVSGIIGVKDAQHNPQQTPQQVPHKQECKEAAAANFEKVMMLKETVRERIAITGERYSNPLQTKTPNPQSSARPPSPAPEFIAFAVRTADGLKRAGIPVSEHTCRLRLEKSYAQYGQERMQDAITRAAQSWHAAGHEEGDFIRYMLKFLREDYVAP